MPHAATPAASASAARGLMQHYQDAARRDYVRMQSLIGEAGGLMEISQPAGHYSSPPTEELLLVQPQRSGISLRKVWGSARFDGVAPTDSLWLIPPRTATDLTVRNRHTIRTLSIGLHCLRDALADAGRLPDFGPLCTGPFFSPVAHHLARAIWHATVQGDDSRLRMDGALHLLVGELARLAGERREPPAGGLAAWQIRVVTEAIADRPAASLSLAELAALVRLSPYHFARAFRASLGVPPHRYQKKIRMERAAALLAGGDLSITEVAFAVGYESGQALARAFRQETGASPRAFRRDRRS